MGSDGICTEDMGCLPDAGCLPETGCLPDTASVIGPGMLTAPLLLVRGLSRRASRWFVLHHQRHLQKLSVRKRQRISQSERLRPSSEPLVTLSPSDEVVNARVRPVSEPCSSSSASRSVNEAILKRPRFPSPKRYFQGRSSAEDTAPLCSEGEPEYANVYLPSEKGLMQQAVLACGCPTILTVVENPCYDLQKTFIRKLAPLSVDSQSSDMVTNQAVFIETDIPTSETYANVSNSDIPSFEVYASVSSNLDSYDTDDDDDDSKLDGAKVSYANIFYVAQISINSEEDGTVSQEIIYRQYVDDDGQGSLQHSSFNAGSPHHPPPPHHPKTAPSEVQPPSVPVSRKPLLPSRNSPPPERAPSAPQQRAPSVLQQRTPSVPQQRAPLAPQQRAPSVLQQRAPSVPQQRAPSVLQQRAPSVPQQRALSVPQQKAPSVPQQRAPSVPQQRAPSVPQQRAPLVPQQRIRSVSPTSSASSNQAFALPLAAERVNIGDGESIELTELYRKLLERPYFHLISRDKSNQLLRNAPNGMFLIRPSTRSRDPLTLSLRYNGRIYNINIRQRNDGYFALGTEKVNEVTFESVDDMVTCYTKSSIKLQSGARIRLTSSPEKIDHIYVKLPLSGRMT